MPITVVRSPADIPSTALKDFGPVLQPLGEPVSRSGREVLQEGDGALEVGLWECTPGRWRRRVMEPEFRHFVASRCVFELDGGEPVAIAAGDSVSFPANSQRTGIAEETLRRNRVSPGAAAADRGASPGPCRRDPRP